MHFPISQPMTLILYHSSLPLTTAREDCCVSCVIFRHCAFFPTYIHKYNSKNQFHPILQFDIWVFRSDKHTSSPAHQNLEKLFTFESMKRDVKTTKRKTNPLLRSIKNFVRQAYLYKYFLAHKVLNVQSCCSCEHFQSLSLLRPTP